MWRIQTGQCVFHEVHQWREQLLFVSPFAIYVHASILTYTCTECKVKRGRCDTSGYYLVIITFSISRELPLDTLSHVSLLAERRKKKSPEPPHVPSLPLWVRPHAHSEATSPGWRCLSLKLSWGRTGPCGRWSGERRRNHCTYSDVLQCEGQPRASWVLHFCSTFYV